jgi:hypothetical protein
MEDNNPCAEVRRSAAFISQQAKHVTIDTLKIKGLI